MTQFKGPNGQEDMPFLLTSGPVTTSRGVKFAMLADWAHSDPQFMRVVQNLQAHLKTLGGADSSYECVLMQGSVAQGMEAALATLTPSKRKKTLIISNGTNAVLASHMLERLGRNHVLLNRSDLKPLRAEDFAKALDEDRNIGHVWLVHGEPASGVVNPLSEIASAVKSRSRALLVDASATFGASAIDMVRDQIDAIVTGPEACLESVPGFSILFIKRDVLMAAKGEAATHVLDLFEQWQSFEAMGQFRFTPPTHAVMALQQALRELNDQGGIAGRFERYQTNADTFETRMKALGFSMALNAPAEGAGVRAVLCPANLKFNLKSFCDKLRAKGFVVSPSKLSRMDVFCVGMMGQVDEKLIVQLVGAIESVMADMDVRSFAPLKGE
jgi:2-aminoethylphosphonate-pyruvate transaminase